jgi:hypothetical protein
LNKLQELEFFTPDVDKGNISRAVVIQDENK